MAQPPGAEPGAAAERFKEQAEQEKKRFEETTDSTLEIEEKREEKETPPTQDLVFELKEVVISGVSVFSPADFEFTYYPYLNKTVSFQDIQKIAQSIENIYNRKGYLTTRVYIPEQTISDGKVIIQVDEGRIGKFKIEGNEWFSSNLIGNYFHQKSKQVLNIKALQRDILRLNQNPDLEVKTFISSGEEEKTSDITLTIKDKLPWHVGFGFDNQGTRLTGKNRSSVYMRSTNFSGLGDSLFVSSLFSHLTFGQSFNYTFPIGSYGTKAGIDVAYFKMKLGKEYKVQDITGKTLMYTPRISWELALEEDYSATAGIGIDIKSITKKQGIQRTSDDQLRIPFLGFIFTKSDNWGRTSFSPRLDFSTEDFLGASSRNHPSASRQGSGGKFVLYEQGLSRVQTMPWESYLSMRTQFQVASHTLPSSEQIQLGGATSIRGYPEGDYLCDTGGNLNLDWIMPMYIIPKDWKLCGAKKTLRQQIEPVIFADLGGGKLKKVNSGERKDKFMAGIGAGLHFRFWDNVYCSLQWAKRLGDRPGGGSGPSNFYLSFQAEM